MTDSAIERLRASKDASERKEITNGRADGRRWAKTKAKYAELRRLAEFDKDSVELDPVNALKNAIDPADEMTSSEVWEYCFGDPEPALSNLWIASFIGGAVEYFEQVRRQL